jgi:metal-sulfur cluster biosynthetic enzyme
MLCAEKAVAPSGGCRRRRGHEKHPGLAVQTNQLDQGSDLWLSAAELDRPSVGTEATGQHGQIEHQRSVGEHELGEIDDDIALGMDRSRERLSADTLRVAILIPAAAKCRRCVIEVDDCETLIKGSDRCHANLAQTGPRFLPSRRTRAEGPQVVRRAGLCERHHGARPRLAVMATVDEVTDALRDVIDPELGLDFVELGLIYEVEVQDSTVRVTYSLTSPGCPIGPQVSEQIEEFVSDLDGVDQVEPTMTFSPPWTPERMSEDAKFALGF